jgi:hypothetical protein
MSEEVLDDMIAINPIKKIVRNTETLFLTNSSKPNPTFSDYSVSKQNFSLNGRFGHASVLINDYLYIFGGFIFNGTNYVCTNDFYRVNITNDVWLKINSANSPSARSYFVMLAKNNLIYIHGGVNFTITIASSLITDSTKTFSGNNVYIFNTTTDTWTTVPVANPSNLSIIRAYTSGFFYGNFFCVANGINNGTLTASGSIIYFETTELIWKTATCTKILNNGTVGAATLTSVYGQRSIIVNSKLYLFYGFNAYPLTNKTNVHYNNVHYFNITTVGTVISFSNGIELTWPNSPPSNFPNSKAFFLLYYDGTYIRLLNGQMYSMMLSTETYPYYNKTGSSKYFFRIYKESCYFNPSLNTTGNQVWSTNTVNPLLLNNPYSGFTLVYHTPNVFIYGGRDMFYNCISTFNDGNTAIQTYSPIYITINNNSFSINDFNVKVRSIHGKVYVSFETTHGKIINFFSLRLQ